MLSFSHAVMVAVTSLVTGTLGTNGVIVPGDTFPGFVNRSGFPVEQHSAVTPDGFVLTLFRLPAHKADAPVILLQHGILASMYSDTGSFDIILGPFIARFCTVLGSNPRHAARVP